MAKKIKVFPKRFGMAPYVFLVYLLMPLYFIIQEEGGKAAIGYALLLLFLLSYRQLYNWKSDGKFSLWLIVQGCVIVLLSIFYHPNNLFLGFYISNFISWYEREKNFKRAIAVFTLVYVGMISYITYAYNIQNVLFQLPFIIVMLISPFAIRNMNAKMELESRLDEANEQIRTLIKREERIRIARDLHDTLGHTLSLITLQSQVIQRVANHPEKVKTEAEGIERTSRTALQQVRELISDMRVITVEEEIAEAEKILQAANIQLHLHMEDVLPNISLLQQKIIGMCIREASTNIVKHSKANNCFLRIEQDESKLSLFIHDDGVGIRDQQWGNGLKGMEERLSLIEGELCVDSEKGTILRISIPIVVKTEEGVVVL
ncbi:sensor histidine kinase [Sporosarcina sp. USHLN248]|uniref:sensor histidine kinase n=1 Tax=Sporosarcina sp. USHLN248 TaxID=3081300 RepID=UPI0030186B92